MSESRRRRGCRAAACGARRSVRIRAESAAETETERQVARCKNAGRRRRGRDECAKDSSADNVRRCSCSHFLGRRRGLCRDARLALNHEGRRLTIRCRRGRGGRRLARAAAHLDLEKYQRQRQLPVLQQLREEAATALRVRSRLASTPHVGPLVPPLELPHPASKALSVAPTGHFELREDTPVSGRLSQPRSRRLNRSVTRSCSIGGEKKKRRGLWVSRALSREARGSGLGGPGRSGATAHGSPCTEMGAPA